MRLYECCIFDFLTFTVFDDLVFHIKYKFAAFPKLSLPLLQHHKRLPYIYLTIISSMYPSEHAQTGSTSKRKPEKEKQKRRENGSGDTKASPRRVSWQMSLVIDLWVTLFHPNFLEEMTWTLTGWQQASALKLMKLGPATELASILTTIIAYYLGSWNLDCSSLSRFLSRAVIVPKPRA